MFIGQLNYTLNHHFYDTIFGLYLDNLHYPVWSYDISNYLFRNIDILKSL